MNHECFTILILFSFLLLWCGPTSSAYQMPSCAFGICDAWVSFDGKNWYNTTYEDVELLRGQSFFIKTYIETKKPDIHVSMNFFEVGVYSASDATFEILDGYVTGIVTQNTSQLYSFGIIKTPSSFEKIWEVCIRENASWWNAKTSLNIITYFNKESETGFIKDWVEEDISFTMIHPYINKTIYHRDTSFIHSDRYSDHMPPHDLPFINIFVFLFFACFIGKIYVKY